MPWRQCGQVPSLNANGAMTKSPRFDVRDVAADVLDDADELVADRAGLERRVAAVVPEVRPADAGEHDADDRVGRLDDDRVAPVAGLDRWGSMKRAARMAQAKRVDRDRGRPCEGVLDRAPLPSCARPAAQDDVDHHSDIAEFLTTRRARITPEQAGLPSYGRRRVKGLRREEVASLAGVSVEYYKRLERGNVSGASELVLEGLARALQLDDAERAHLFDLVRAANPVAPKRPRPVKQRIRPVVQRILDQITAPATVRNARLDYIGANTLGRALYAPLFDSREQPANSARFTFLDPAAADFYPEWEHVASELVAHLRSEAGRNPYDRQLSDLVGELSTRSDEFRDPLGRAQRALPPHRYEAHPPSRRRRARAQLRDDGAQRRRRPERRDLHRRAGLGRASRRSTCSPAGARRRTAPTRR